VRHINYQFQCHQGRRTHSNVYADLPLLVFFTCEVARFATFQQEVQIERRRQIMQHIHGGAPFYVVISFRVFAIKVLLLPIRQKKSTLLCW
jgi:hypothetical protein